MKCRSIQILALVALYAVNVHASIEDDLGKTPSVKVSLGQKFSLVLKESSSGALTPALVMAEAAGKSAITVSLFDIGNDSGRLLSVANAYGKTVQYKALICIVKLNKCAKTNVLAVGSGLTGYESWRGEIDAVIMYDFKFVDRPPATAPTETAASSASEIPHHEVSR